MSAGAPQIEDARPRGVIGESSTDATPTDDAMEWLSAVLLEDYAPGLSPEAQRLLNVVLGGSKKNERPCG